MVKLANTYGSGPYVARLAGSSPVTRTKLSVHNQLEDWKWTLDFLSTLLWIFRIKMLFGTKKK